MTIVDFARSLFGNAPVAFAGSAPSLADVMWRSALNFEEQRRLDAYNKAWDVYQGNLKQPLVVKPDGPNDNVTINYGRIIVDKSVSFLFGQEPQFELSEGAETPAEAWT